MGKRSIETTSSSSKRGKLETIKESDLFDDGLSCPKNDSKQILSKKRRKKSSDKPLQSKKPELKKPRLKESSPQSPNSQLAPSPCDSGISSVGNSPINSFIKSPIPHSNSIQKDVGLDCIKGKEDPRKRKSKEARENLVKLKLNNGTLSNERSKSLNPRMSSDVSNQEFTNKLFDSLLFSLPQFSFSERTSERFGRIRQYLKHQDTCETEPLYASYALRLNDDRDRYDPDTRRSSKQGTNELDVTNSCSSDRNFIIDAKTEKSSNFKLPLTDYKQSTSKSLNHMWIKPKSS